MAASPASPRLAAGELKALVVRSDAQGSLRLAGHLAALAATGSVVVLTVGSAWVVPALFVHGYVLIFLFCALHEATHYTPFRSRWPCTVLGHACGFLLLLPFEYFRLFHWDHHRFTQDPEHDPELARPKPASLAEYLLHISGLPNWKTRLLTIGTHALSGQVRQPWIPSAEHARVVREARLYGLGYAGALSVSIGLGSAALLWLWVLPAMAGQIYLRNYLLAEHTGCAANADPFANTRTTYTSALVRFFAWNMPYHVEHHAYPAIPFHALPAANRRLRTFIQVGDPGYVAALQSILGRLRRPPAPLTE
jgi:fatty acid desaturase